jgi:peptide deformylase
MAHLQILVAPDPNLEIVAEPVAAVDKSVQKIVDDLVETMRAENGAGIAATQVGINKRIFLLDISSYIPEIKDLFIIINPVITYSSPETWTTTEGCLSFPGIGRISIERPKSIKMEYLDYHGNKKEIVAEDWLARGFLHELDHLNGITMLHHVSNLKKNLYTKKLIKYKKNHNIV